MEQKKEFLWRGSPAAVLHLEGEDCFSYLQSQVTNKISEVSGSCTYALCLNRKGKVLADCYIFTINESDFYLLSYFIEASELLEIIENNIIADDVDIEEVTKNYELLTFFNHESNHCIEDKNVYHGDFREKVYFQGNRGIECSYEVLVWSEEKSSESNKEVSNFQGSIDLGGELLDRCRIEAKIPKVGVDIKERHLPQEGGLEAMALHFNKGCYLGQEVMARIHAQGKVNRRLVLLQIKHIYDFSFPMNVVVSESKKVVGEITSGFTIDGGVVCLGVLRKSLLQEKLVILDHPDIEIIILD